MSKTQVLWTKPIAKLIIIPPSRLSYILFYTFNFIFVSQYIQTVTVYHFVLLLRVQLNRLCLFWNDLICFQTLLYFLSSYFSFPISLIALAVNRELLRTSLLPTRSLQVSVCFIFIFIFDLVCLKTYGISPLPGIYMAITNSNNHLYTFTPVTIML